MTEEAIASCEAVKTSYRQTKSGIAVTFTIHPSDIHDKLALLELGTTVRLYVTKPEIGA